MADRLNRLIQHQKVFIDAHGKEESPEIRPQIFDDPAYDLHLHKNTNPVSINGKKEYEVDIRIPLNNPTRKMVVEYGGKKHEEVPCRLRDEIQEALSDDGKRDAFAYAIGQILMTYPSRVLDNKMKTISALQKIARCFGVDTILIQDSWFTHIDQWQKGIRMMSMVSKDNNRYNFMATDDYILAEQAELTKKHIVALYSGEKRGKSESIRVALQILLERYPEHAVIIDDGSESGDMKALLFINGAKVGIESQGDPNSRQMQSIEEFASLGCDVILTASRTFGMTTDAIGLHQKQYEVKWIRKRGEKDESLHSSNNRQMAEKLVAYVEEYANSAFNNKEY